MIDRSDTDLISLARAGDKVAFGQLIERHQTMVRRLTSKMVRNEHLVSGQKGPVTLAGDADHDITITGGIWTTLATGRWRGRKKVHGCRNQ